MELATTQPLARVIKGQPLPQNGQRLGWPGYPRTSTLPLNLGIQFCMYKFLDMP